MAATATVHDFPLATEHPYTGGQDGGPGTVNSGDADGSAAGASGSTGGGLELSRGGLIAIIVVVVVVGLVGSEYTTTNI